MEDLNWGLFLERFGDDGLNPMPENQMPTNEVT